MVFMLQLQKRKTGPTTRGNGIEVRGYRRK
jgi:hypothetical protein